MVIIRHSRVCAFICVKSVTETTKITLTLGLRQSSGNVVCDDDDENVFLELLSDDLYTCTSVRYILYGVLCAAISGKTERIEPIKFNGKMNKRKVHSVPISSERGRNMESKIYSFTGKSWECEFVLFICINEWRKRTESDAGIGVIIRIYSNRR